MSHRLLDYRPTIAALGPPRKVPRLHGESVDVNELHRAAELLEHADANQLEAYLGKLVDRVADRAPSRLRHALAAALASIGRPLLRQNSATPRAAAGRVFGLELEGLSPEDQAFEVARHFARFAADAASHASRGSNAGSPPAAVRHAVMQAARKFAPGLQPAAPSVPWASGTWFRRGRELIVLNP